MTQLRDIKPNLFDRAVMYVDPVRGMQRLHARAKHEALAGAWVGGASGRSTLQNYRPHAGDAKSDTLYDLPDLRARSRDMARNSPMALGAINTNVTNVVGTGLMARAKPDAKYLKWSEEKTQDWADYVNRRYELWGNSVNCDAARVLNQYGQQSLAFRSTLESGDTIALLPSLKRPNSPNSTTVQLIEADRVSNPNNKPDCNELAGGIEYSSWGEPLAVWISRHHPGGIGRVERAWDRYPMYSASGRRNVIHLFCQNRIGQGRGVPYLSPVIETLKEVTRMTSAELRAAVIDASFAVFVERDINYETPESGTTDIVLPQGTVAYTDAGEKVVTHEPNRPNTAFDPFVTAMFRQVGVALELPYEVLVKHFQSSYSAARAALLQAWRFFRVRREWLATYYCQPIREVWFEEEVLMGAIEAPGFFTDPLARAAYLRTQWTGDGPGSIDELKEASAAEKRLDVGLTTLEEEIALYDGGEWSVKHEQQAREKKARKADDLMPDAPSLNGGLPPDGEEETDTKETKETDETP